MNSFFKRVLYKLLLYRCYRTYPFSGAIDNVVVSTSTYDLAIFLPEYASGGTATLKADAKPVCYATSSGRDPVAVLYDNNYVLESLTWMVKEESKNLRQDLRLRMIISYGIILVPPAWL